MKNNYVIINVLLLSLSGCSSNEPSATGAVSATGSNRDEHGCIGSAGYSWCAVTGKCERPWELAEQAGFQNTQAEFEAYCGE